MPDPFKPSEFGGKTDKRGIQPKLNPLGKPGHEQTVSEKLRLTYTTGAVDGEVREGEAYPDGGDAMTGFIPLEEQVKLRKQAGEIPKEAKTSETVWSPPDERMGG